MTTKSEVASEDALILVKSFWSMSPNYRICLAFIDTLMQRAGFYVGKARDLKNVSQKLFLKEPE